MKVTVIDVEALANLVGFHPRCNVYCNGEEHAEVMWVALESPLTEASLPDSFRAQMVESFGVAYRSHQYAPEAPRAPEHLRTVAVAHGEQGVSGIREEEADPALPRHPYLVRFVSPIPLEWLRGLLKHDE